MNEEEKKAIEEIGLIIESFYDFPNPISIYLKDKDVKFLETLLNLIQTQQAEIEQLKQAGNAMDLLLKQKIEELEKKDKIIKELEEKLSERNMEEH